MKNVRAMFAYDINKIIPKHYEAYPVWQENIWQSYGVELRLMPLFVFRFGHFDDYNPTYDCNRRKDWTVGFGSDLKFLCIDISNTNAFYLLSSDEWHYSLSINLGDPVFPKDGFLSLLSKH